MIKYLKYLYPRFEWTINTNLSKEQLYKIVRSHTKVDGEYNDETTKEDIDFLGEINTDKFKLYRKPKSSYRGIPRPVLTGIFQNTHGGARLAAVYEICWKGWFTGLCVSIGVALLPIFLIEEQEMLYEFAYMYLHYVLPFIIVFSYLNFWFETLCGISALQAYLNQYRI